MNLVESVLQVFPDVKALLLGGSTGSDFIEGISDLDLIIIGPKLENPLPQLQKLVDINSAIDPIYIPKANLDKSLFVGQKLAGEYELHSFDLYRLHYQGQLLYGDQSILSMFPLVTLNTALVDTLPYVRDAFINDLAKKANDPITDNLDELIVICRAIYAIETQSYGSKLTALDYLIGKYPAIKNLILMIKDVYLKTVSKDIILHPIEFRSLLDLANTIISNYLR